MKFIREYEIKGPSIGSGGVATVYLVEKKGKQYAAKVLHQHLMRDRRVVSRFKQEYEIGQMMKAYNAFINMHELMKYDGSWVIIMDYTPRVTLETLSNQIGKLPPIQATAIVSNIARSLESFHDKGYVHRNIKPSNILITSEGSVKIINYCIARDLTAQLTDKRTVVGSPMYMAPEQLCSSRKTDSSSDLYSLGLIYYRLLCQKDPHDIEDDFNFMQIAEARTKKPLDLDSDLSEDLALFIQKCLSVDPAKRFMNCKDFYSELEELEAFGSGSAIAIDVAQISQFEKTETISIDPSPKKIRTKETCKSLLTKICIICLIVLLYIFLK